MVDLAMAIETAKSDVPILQSRQYVDGWRERVGLKDHCRRQIGKLLGELPIHLPRGNPIGITQVVIHGPKARRAQVSQPADLDGGRLLGKRQ